MTEPQAGKYDDRDISMFVKEYDKSPYLREQHDREMELWRKRRDMKND